MTTRFSLAELAEMLGAPLPAVRRAVETLADRGELTAESFSFAGRNWRIAPSDVKRVQDWLHEQAASGRLVVERPVRRVKSRRVVSPSGQAEPARERGSEDQ